MGSGLIISLDCHKNTWAVDPEKKPTTFDIGNDSTSSEESVGEEDEEKHAKNRDDDKVWEKLPDEVFSGEFKVFKDSIIGKGAFGIIVDGRSDSTENPVAIKFEDINCSDPQLFKESRIYSRIWTEGAVGIPTYYGFETSLDYSILVMSKIGKDLAHLLTLCGGVFSLKTITRIEYIHQQGYIHRDIKPENFLIGLGENSRTVYCLDFGLAKKLINMSGKHIPIAFGQPQVGTGRYMSIHSHEGVEQSRRDDLMAIGYMCVYFLKGSLPWMNIKAKTAQEQLEKIWKRKKKTSWKKLCDGLGPEFVKFFKIVKKMKFDEEPDYEGLRQLFRNLYTEKQYKDDLEFDWIGKL